MPSDHSARVREIAGWLRLFLTPGTVTECRAIYGDRQVRNSFHDGPEALALRAVHLDEVPDPSFGKLPKGVYFTPNPLRAEMLDARGKGANAAAVLEQVRAALDSDLDTPGAIEAIDDAAASGLGVSEAAALLGVRTDRTVFESAT